MTQISKDMIIADILQVDPASALVHGIDVDALAEQCNTFLTNKKDD